LSNPSAMLVATEASGDLIGAELARALRERLGPGGIRLVGVGGERMAAEGIVSPFPIADLSIVGVFDGLPALPKIHRRVDQTVELARRERPDAAVLIDSWGFSVRLASRLRRLRPRPALIKYVLPQVWASRPWRARAVARLFDRLLAINSFDAPLYARQGAALTFVGNPALARDFSRADGARLRTKIGAKPGDPLLLLLPGSRPSEVGRLMGPFEGAVEMLRQRRPNLEVAIAAAPSVAEDVRALNARWRRPAHLVEGDEGRFDAMVAATAAIACSGTVTTELAMAGCPMIVAYKLGFFSYPVARLLITTPWITLINIAAGASVVPELVQGNCAPEALAEEIAPLLDDVALRTAQAARQSEAVEKLRGGILDPIGAAADAVIDVLRIRSKPDVIATAGPTLPL
jgi:lipid-A-disaccharide synthase